MERERSDARARVRPTEIATLASAVLLLATAALPGSDEERPGVVAAFALSVAYIAVWYHVLPFGTFGRARYVIGGGVVQLILVYLLLTTGGARSAWFVFYLLPVLATVFSYDPASTLGVALVAATGLIALAVGDPSVRTASDARELLFTRLVGFLAISSMAYMITRAMRSHRRTMQDQSARLREVLAVTEREAMTDPLTAVHNRRALDQVLGRASSRAERDGHAYSVLLIDVDSLKAVNDAEGHAVGDRALRLVASAAQQVVRGYDVVARFGGDEFVVVLHETTDAGARTTAERVKAKARELLGSDAMLAGTTISVGAATWREGLTPKDLLAAADADMYAEKREHREGRAAAG